MRKIIVRAHKRVSSHGKRYSVRKHTRKIKIRKRGYIDPQEMENVGFARGRKLTDNAPVEAIHGVGFIRANILRKEGKTKVSDFIEKEKISKTDLIKKEKISKIHDESSPEVIQRWFDLVDFSDDSNEKLHEEFAKYPDTESLKRDAASILIRPSDKKLTKREEVEKRIIKRIREEKAFINLGK